MSLAATLALASACAPTQQHSSGATAASRRHGPERLTTAYADARSADKRLIFERINRDRAVHGVAPLRYEPRAARVGDRFCVDTALGGSWGHWDSAGRAPYVRWGLAGGVDYHAENAASYSDSDGALETPVATLALMLHQQMMDETPPRDGHRRAILDPLLTHVGIGLGHVAGEFRLTEEFTRVAMEWVDAPARALRPGDVAVFGGKPLDPWRIGLIEVRHEPPLRPMALPELLRRGDYSYPPLIRTLRPRLSGSFQYAGGHRGDFAVDADGSFRFTYVVGPEAGYDFVLCYVHPRENPESNMSPATAAMIAIVNE